MNELFTAVAGVIKQRRTIKPFMMNGSKIPNEQVQALLELADWAPTHGYTEPWRFVVYADPTAFCGQHAALYKTNTLPDDFVQGTYDSLAAQGNKASHVVIAIMKRGDKLKIPALEEIASTACAVENLLLGATALNIASYWGTGGMTLKPAMKDFLGLGDDDQVMGILYLGYADEKPEGRRTVPLSEKVSWR